MIDDIYENNIFEFLYALIESRICVNKLISDKSYRCNTFSDTIRRGERDGGDCDIFDYIN